MTENESEGPRRGIGGRWRTNMMKRRWMMNEDALWDRLLQFFS